MTHAYAPEDWRPGFAKRAPNFGAVCQQAISWEPDESMTVWRVKDAIVLGTPELTMTERCVLLAYAAHLGQDRMLLGDAYVWPSAELIADHLSCSEATVRGARRTLEMKGYLVRDYNRANRPAGPKAIDLAPLVARLSELEDLVDGPRARRAARLDSLKEAVVSLHEYRTQAPEYSHLEQSHLQGSKEPVREADTPTARNQFASRRPAVAEPRSGPTDSGQRPAGGTPSAICSPGGASGFGGALPGGSEHAEMVRQELAAAAQVCPAIAPLVTPALLKHPTQASADTVAEWAELAARLLPDPERNNDQTFMWAYKRHGPRALAMLAASLTDTNVQSPCRYFGRLASTDGRNPLDLRFNFRRILALMPAPAVRRGPGIDNELWQAME
ncbi:MAG: helix-turn-helix domain-containing protein, partial [Salinibacterium sp.]